MRLILMLVACVAVCAIAAVAAAHAGPVPPPSGHWQIICSLGKDGLPSGCHEVWVGPMPQ